MLESHLVQLFCKVAKALGGRTQLKEVGHLESIFEHFGWFLVPHSLPHDCHGVKATASCFHRHNVLYSITHPAPTEPRLWAKTPESWSQKKTSYVNRCCQVL